MFNRRVVVEFEKPEEIDIEELELELIDFGLEEFEIDDKTVYAYGDYTNFGTLTKAFEDRGIKIEKADLQRFPTSPIEVSDEQMVDIEKLINKLEDDDDIQNVFTNLG
jgi:transcriptional/translational regulatory protein YebC/TACO1